MTDSSTFQVRETVGETAHVCQDGQPVCGSKATKLVTVRNEATAEWAQRYVTCSKCRKANGWFVMAGSYRSRSTAGLDSSAWGANKGR